MTQNRRFFQLDVFSPTPLRGNPLAVVVDAQGLDDADMARFARWTNLSETTFLLPPTEPGADYRVRIFTPFGELPFAGHPTLGSCAAWLASGGQPRQADEVVQRCAAGLIRIRRDPAQPGRLAFAAPPCRRTGPLEPEMLAQIAAGLGLAPEAIVGHQWVDNGPGWCAVRLANAQAVSAVIPDWAALAELKLGLVGHHAQPQDAQTDGGAPADWEVRALIGPTNGIQGFEDPVTGSLNASLAQWLIASGQAQPRYVAAQGRALGRAGRVQVEQEAGPGSPIWIGGDVCLCISATLTL